MLIGRSRLAAAMDELSLRISRASREGAQRDIEAERQRQALASTASFVTKEMPHAQPVRGRGRAAPQTIAKRAKFDLIDRALALAPARGLVLEFGVFEGETLRHLAARRSPVHGFDSFEGLPESWRSGLGKGVFATDAPSVPGAKLHVGWFDDTLPRFLAANDGPVALAHLDADLYSSTATVLDGIAPRLIPGSVLLFDEYFNFPGWEEGEHKAFTEFIARTGRPFEYVAYNVTHEQVLVRMTG